MIDSTKSAISLAFALSAQSPDVSAGNGAIKNITIKGNLFILIQRITQLLKSKLNIYFQISTRHDDWRANLNNSSPHFSYGQYLLINIRKKIRTLQFDQDVNILRKCFPSVYVIGMKDKRDQFYTFLTHNLTVLWN